MAYYKKAFQTAAGRWGDLIGGFAVLLLIRLAALAPLTALGTRAPIVAVLCPVLIVFGVMPLRENTAAALIGFVNGGRFFTPALVNLTCYGRQLANVLLRMLILCLFFVPLAALTWFISYHFSTMDAFTFLRTVITMGGGSFETGLLVWFGIIVMICLPIPAGMGLFCADRFYTAAGRGKVSKHTRRVFFKGWLLGSTLLLPSVFLIAGAVLTAAPRFIQTMMKDRSGFKPALYMAAAAVVLYALAMPVRKLITPLVLADQNQKIKS